MKLAFHSRIKCGNKVIYVLQIQKRFVNVNKSHSLYFMHLNTFF